MPIDHIILYYENLTVKKCLKLLELSSNLQLSVFMALGQLYLLYCVVHYNSSASETNCMIIFFVLYVCVHVWPYGKAI